MLWCNLTEAYSLKPGFSYTIPQCTTNIVSLRQQRNYFLVHETVQPHTFISASADSRQAVVSYWRKYSHEVLINRLGGLSPPRRCVYRLTDRK